MHVHLTNNYVYMYIEPREANGKNWSSLEFFGTEESSLLGAKLSHEFRFLSCAVNVISVKRECFVKLAT